MLRLHTRSRSKNLNHSEVSVHTGIYKAASTSYSYFNVSEKKTTYENPCTGSAGSFLYCRS